MTIDYLTMNQNDVSNAAAAYRAIDAGWNIHSKFSKCDVDSSHARIEVISDSYWRGRRWAIIQLCLNIRHNIFTSQPPHRQPRFGVALGESACLHSSTYQHFYALQLCKRVPATIKSSVCPSVCVSVTRVYCDKTNESSADVLIPVSYTHLTLPTIYSV